MIIEKFKESKFYIIVIIGLLIIGGLFYVGMIQTDRDNSSKIECINFRDARDYIGQEKCVYGKVYNVHITPKGMTFINFCEDFRICPFRSIIFGSDINKFSNVEKYKGKDVIIKGEITTFQGETQIILRKSEQLKLKTFGF